MSKYVETYPGVRRMLEEKDEVLNFRAITILLILKQRTVL